MKGPTKGRPKGKLNQRTIYEFKTILEKFANGEATFGVVYYYMKKKGWINKNAPDLPIIMVKQQCGAEHPREAV